MKTIDNDYYKVLNKIANYRDHTGVPVWNWDFKKFVEIQSMRQLRADALTG